MSGAAQTRVLRLRPGGGHGLDFESGGGQKLTFESGGGQKLTFESGGGHGLDFESGGIPGHDRGAVDRKKSDRLPDHDRKTIYQT